MQAFIKKFILLTVLIGTCAGSLFLHIQYKNSQRIVVCIDPGHGGYDTGAQADDGTNEKDLTLEYAQDIGKYLHQYDPRLTIIYTRDSDEVSWPSNEEQDLKARVQYAQNNGADYYLSIHFNTASSTDAYGYTAYIKNTDTESEAIYKNIVKNLNAANWKYDRGLQTTANRSLYVVDYLRIPSMLMEVGFLTNNTELNNLKDNENRETICKAIAKGYADYLKNKQKENK